MSEKYNRAKLKTIDPTYKIQFWYDREFNLTNCIIKVLGTYYFGQATCHENDQFSKMTGRAISLGRAVSNLEHGKPTTDRLPTIVQI